MIRRRVVADGSGGCLLRLRQVERDLLRSLPEELAPILAAFGSGRVEPAGTMPDSMRRLFPPAYTTDDDAEARFASATRSELADHHREALELLASTASASSLGAEQMHGWLTALNDLRLVLGTVLGVTEGDDLGVPLRRQLSQQMIVYRFLSVLQAELIDVAEGTLPPPVPGADDDVPDDPWGDPIGGLRWDGTPLPPPTPPVW